MRNLILGAVALAMLAGCVATKDHRVGQAAIAASIADAARPVEDVQRDANRKPADMLAFSGVKPGDKVVDFLPGGGYFTRLFAKAVGPSGTVYAATPPGRDGKPAAVKAAAAAYPNVQVVDLADIRAAETMRFPAPADIVWTSQNYHDLHAKRFNVDLAAFNRGVYAALKPGGLYIVLDHAAAPGTAIDPEDKLHRIDPEIVKKEVVAAGFVFAGESSVLRNPDDKHDLNVFDPAIRGRTDQFVYKFRKPK